MALLAKGAGGYSGDFFGRPEPSIANLSRPPQIVLPAVAGVPLADWSSGPYHPVEQDSDEEEDAR